MARDASFQIEHTGHGESLLLDGGSEGFDFFDNSKGFHQLLAESVQLRAAM
jgi:hypothetical protein